MTHTRKNFNYLTATVVEIAQHFKTSSRQAIYSVQKAHADDVTMTTKIKQALLMYKMSKLQDELC